MQQRSRPHPDLEMCPEGGVGQNGDVKQASEHGEKAYHPSLTHPYPSQEGTISLFAQEAFSVELPSG